MKRRFAWLLGLSLVANPALSQDAPSRPVETPRTPAPAVAAPAPVAEQGILGEYFAAPVVTTPSVSFGVGLLQWWYKRDSIPSLLNTAVETNTLFAGTANDPTAVSLFGTSQYGYKTVPGICANLEINLADNIDFELGGFLMESQSLSQSFAGTNGRPFLTRPFYNPHDLVESGFDTSSMSGISGNFNVSADNQFYGYEANIAWNTQIADNNIRKLIFGFRQVTLNENLSVTENVSANGPGFLAFYPSVDPNGVLVNANFDPATQSIRIIDRFSARNQFYGPQAGAQWRWSKGPFSFDLTTKVAVGVNHESIRVGGTTSLLTGGAITATGANGLLAVATNSGSYTSNELTVVPELGVRFNFDVTSHLKVNVGYNILYMSSAVRPGTQIDRRINPQFVPSDVAYNPNTSGPLLPRAFFRDTDFYAHGVSFGLVLSY